MPKIMIKAVDAFLIAGWINFLLEMPFSVCTTGFSGRTVIFFSLTPQFFLPHKNNFKTVVYNCHSRLSIKPKLAEKAVLRAGINPARSSFLDNRVVIYFNTSL
jgi:hypothetical protein